MDKIRPKRVVGAFEAKTRLAEILRDAENGVSYTIQRRGKTVAEITPPRRLDDAALEETKARLRKLRARLKGKYDIKAMIEEGRQ